MASAPKAVKKLSKVGEGTVVFLTTEIGLLGWKQGDYVSVEVIDDGAGKIILRRVAL